MPKTRFTLVAVLAAALLAAACGGDETATDEPDDAREGVTTAAAEEAESEAVADSAGQTQAEPAPEPEPEPVQLGNRFAWCAEYQALSDSRVAARAQLDEAEAALHAAQETLAVATDELDRAEAQDALAPAEERHRNAVSDHWRANRELAYEVLAWTGTSDDTEAIARDRARDAYLAAADPAVPEMVELLSQGVAEMPPMPEAELLGPLTLDEVLGAMDALRRNVVALGGAFDAVLQDYEAIIAAVQDAETPSDVLAANAAFLDWRGPLSALYAQHAETLSQMKAYTITEWLEAYDAFAGHNEAISDTEYYNSRDTITEAYKELSYAVTAAPSYDNFPQDSVNWLRNAQRDAIPRIIVGYTAGIAAFWASLSESCQG